MPATGHRSKARTQPATMANAWHLVHAVRYELGQLLRRFAGDYGAPT